MPLNQINLILIPVENVLELDDKQIFSSRRIMSNSPPFMEAICGLGGFLESVWAYQVLYSQCLSTLQWIAPSSPRFLANLEIRE